MRYLAMEKNTRRKRNEAEMLMTIYYVSSYKVLNSLLFLEELACGKGHTIQNGPHRKNTGDSGQK